MFHKGWKTKLLRISRQNPWNSGHPYTPYFLLFFNKSRQTSWVSKLGYNKRALWLNEPKSSHFSSILRVSLSVYKYKDRSVTMHHFTHTKNSVLTAATTLLRKKKRRSTPGIVQVVTDEGGWTPVFGKFFSRVNILDAAKCVLCVRLNFTIGFLSAALLFWKNKPPTGTYVGLCPLKTTAAAFKVSLFL